MRRTIAHLRLTYPTAAGEEIHTFTAHSGEDSMESCEIVLAVDYSRRNRTEPRLFSELNQPTTFGIPEVCKTRSLVVHLRDQVQSKLEEVSETVYEEAL